MYRFMLDLIGRPGSRELAAESASALAEQLSASNLSGDALITPEHRIAPALQALITRIGNQSNLQHDVLTDLPNRALCIKRLNMAVQQAERNHRRVAVLFIDLDRFKNINDSLGHHIGDGLLRSVSHRLLETVRAGDTVSRIGDDEFVVILNGVADVEEISQIIERRLIPLIRQPHDIDGAELHVSCSIDIAVYPEDGREIDTLMRNADAAMYQAKSQGRNSAQFFTIEMDPARRRSLDPLATS